MIGFLWQCATLHWICPIYKKVLILNCTMKNEGNCWCDLYKTSAFTDFIALLSFWDKHEVTKLVLCLRLLFSKTQVEMGHIKKKQENKLLWSFITLQKGRKVWCNIFILSFFLLLPTFYSPKEGNVWLLWMATKYTFAWSLGLCSDVPAGQGNILRYLNWLNTVLQCCRIT